MKTVISLLFLWLPLIMQSCGFVYERHLTGNYYLVAVDTKEDMDVCYHQQKDDDAPYTGITEHVFMQWDMTMILFLSRHIIF